MNIGPCVLSWGRVFVDHLGIRYPQMKYATVRSSGGSRTPNLVIGRRRGGPSSGRWDEECLIDGIILNCYLL